MPTELCAAMSKQRGLPCGNYPLKGKRVCKFHGGKSTGAKTPEGRARKAAATTIHGRETKEARRLRSEKLQELRLLERFLKGLD